MIKYEIHNQLTGLNEFKEDFEDAKLLLQNIREEYIRKLVDPLFTITVMVQNEDGSWTQSLADENGYPVLANIDFPTE